MYLWLVRYLDPVHRGKHKSDNGGHFATAPSGDFGRRFSHRRCQHRAGAFGQEWRLAQWSDFVPQQPVETLLGEVALPIPMSNREPTPTGAPRHFEYRNPVRRNENELGSLNILSERRQSSAIATKHEKSRLLGSHKPPLR